MSQFDYSTISKLYAAPKTSSQLINACLKIGEKYHGETREDKRFREKLSPHDQMPAWTHLVMTYNILELLTHGEPMPRKEIILCAALLHDFQEDTKFIYPASSAQVLEDELIRQGLSARDASGFANEIIKIVEELTQLKSDGLDKRLYQVDHANDYSDEAKIVKYSEFCASMIDDILIPSSSGPEKAIRFANKSQSLAHAMSRGFKPEAKFAIALGELAKEYHSRQRNPEKDEKFKKNLLDKIKKRASHLKLPKACEGSDFEVCDTTMEDGVFAKKVNKENEVTHFVAAAGPEHYWLISNRFINAMIAQIEVDPHNHMYESPIDSYGNRCGRRMTLAKPIPLKEFEQMERKAKQIEEVVVTGKVLLPLPPHRLGVWDHE